jgi:aminodeoxyfutalosine deaminase
MMVYRAGWVLPVSSPPVRNGWVAVEGGRVIARGTASEEPPGGEVRALPGSAVLPGLVNAHTHLELSYLHRRVPPSPRFSAWVRHTMRMRDAHRDPVDPQIVETARAALAAARATGTSLVGDVSNTLMTVDLLREAGMAAQVFFELTGFAEQDPRGRVRAARAQADACARGGSVRVSVAPHAPYSVSAALFQAIGDDLASHPDSVSSVQLGESPEELQLLREGAGDMRRVLEELGRWPADWRPPGVGPVTYLDRLGVLGPRMLAVHGVQLGPDDVACLAARGATLVTCPRSNRHVGVGDPPLERFFASGVRVAVGTDSLASADDLNVFAELAAMRALAPSVAAGRLIESATRSGAAALGVGDEMGTIDAGMRAELIAVRVPPDVHDVEEYLVSGVQPDAVGWLAAGA